MHGNADTPKKAKRVRKKTLFFKVIDYNGRSLVFAPPRMAESHDRVMRALVNSQTWGEFRANIPASVLREMGLRGKLWVKTAA
jgi:hypothetical protein